MEKLDDGKRNLRSGVSLWQGLSDGRSPPATLPPSSVSVLRADAVIIGAGVTGAFLAERLSRDGLTVILIDSRKPATGSTLASTAMLQWELDAPLLQLEDRLGFDAAQRIHLQCRQAVNNIGELAARLRIDCRFAFRPSVYLSGNDLDPASLHEEHRLRQHMGAEGRFLDADGLAREGLQADAALKYAGAAETDPYALTLGLLNAAVARGARIISPATAGTQDETARAVTVQTREGMTVEASWLILANGYEMPDYVPARLHRIRSSWALATAPLHAEATWPTAKLVWEAATPYLYFRSAAGGRVVAGGEDEDIMDAAKRDALVPRKTEAILKGLRERCPGLAIEGAEFTWAGFFGETTDSLPLIGRVPGKTRTLAAFGYGGNGISFSAMAADMIAAEISGSRHANADLYALDRN